MASAVAVVVVVVGSVRKSSAPFQRGDIIDRYIEEPFQRVRPVLTGGDYSVRNHYQLATNSNISSSSSSN